MHIPEYFTAFNTKAAIIKSRLFPLKTSHNNYPLTCLNCKFINSIEYHFCTNCGYPIHPNKDNLNIYNLRVNRRKAIEKSCAIKLVQSRNALYTLAGFLGLGIFYAFSDDNATYIKGIVMLFLCAMYAGLGRWSLAKPFTSFLIGLMILLTFAAITSWSEFIEKKSNSFAFYILFLQGIFIYYLWQGTKAAFHAEMLEEETKL